MQRSEWSIQEQTCRKCSRSARTVEGTNAVIDGMMAVMQSLAHCRQDATVEEEADLVQMKQAAGALRELSKQKSDRILEGEKEKQQKRGDKYANGQRRRGESGDEGGNGAGLHAPTRAKLGTR